MAQTNNFHFVRLAAASLVVVGHSYELLAQRAPVWFDASVSAFAVRIFFVVSGYLICESWNQDRSIFRYLLRRSLRIFPGLAAVVVLSALLVGPVITEQARAVYFHNPQVLQYFWNILLAPNFALPGVFLYNPFGSAVNGSLWTLPAEFAMYLLLPLYGSATSSVCRRVLLPIALVGFGGAGYFYALHPAEMMPVVWWNSLPQLLRWAPYFLAGAAVRIWMLQRFLNLHAAIVALALIAGLFESTATRNILLIVLTPYAVLAFCLAPNAFLERLVPHADISYGIYLYAFPIQQTLIAWFGPGLNPLVLIATAMPLSWFCGFASWHAIEKHALRLKPRHRAVETPSGMGASTAAIPSIPNVSRSV